MDSHHRYAVIPTYNRHEMVTECVLSLKDQVDGTVIVDNGSNPIVTFGPDVGPILIRRVPMRPPNLSALWNTGLRTADQMAMAQGAKTWDIAVVNDDAIIPPGWMTVVGDAMRKLDASAAGSIGGAMGDPIRYGAEVPPAVHTRLPGWAFILRGEHGMRADETMQWWCGDDDLSMQARQAKGLVLVPGMDVPNRLANSTTTGILLEQSAKDVARFVEKWGVRPW